MVLDPLPHVDRLWLQSPPVLFSAPREDEEDDEVWDDPVDEYHIVAEEEWEDEEEASSTSLQESGCQILIRCRGNGLPCPPLLGTPLYIWNTSYDEIPRLLRGIFARHSFQGQLKAVEGGYELDVNETRLVLSDRRVAELLWKAMHYYDVQHPMRWLQSMNTLSKMREWIKGISQVQKLGSTNAT